MSQASSHAVMQNNETINPTTQNLSTTPSTMMTANPKPRFFVTRPDQTISPLIALDELPENVNILGIPKTMTSAETTFMISLGVAERSGTFVVDCGFSDSSSVSESQESSSMVSENFYKEENIQMSGIALAKKTTRPEITEAAAQKTIPLSHDNAERQRGIFSGNIGGRAKDQTETDLPIKKPLSLDDFGPDAADAVPLEEDTAIQSSKDSLSASDAIPVTAHSLKIDEELSHLPINDVIRSEDAVLGVSNSKDVQHEVNSSSTECVERPDGRCAEGDDRMETKEVTQVTESEGAVSVESWRQQVNTDDEKPVEATQAVIDALVKEPVRKEKEVNGTTGTEVGLVPGQKVYCTHWIRKGECDYLQQGCRYKHEMPDMKTLRAIGFNTPPHWFLTTHREEARKRGFPLDNPNTTSTPPNWRREPKAFTGPPHATFRPYQRPQPPAFIQPPSIEFPSTGPVTPFHPSTRFAQEMHQPVYASSHQRHNVYPRVQELSDQQYRQWQNAQPLRGNEVKYRSKPRTPGFKTFPFQLPAPEPVHAQRPPIWSTRPSRVRPISMALDHESVTKQPNSSHSPKESKQIPTSTLRYTIDEPQNPDLEKVAGQVVQSETEQAPAVSSPSPSNIALNVSHVPLEPSPRPDPKVVLAAARERKASVSSDLFALAPKTYEPTPIRRFVPPGEDLRNITSDKPAAPQNSESSNLGEDRNTTPGVVDSFRNGHRKGRRVPGGSRDHERRKEHQRIFGPGFEQPKRGRKRTVGSSSGKNGRENRTPNGRSEATELLLDLGN